MANLSATLLSAAQGLRVSDLTRAAEQAQARRPGPSLVERAQAIADEAMQSPPPRGAAQALIERLRAAPPLVLPTR
jgi:hypothetical protein